MFTRVSTTVCAAVLWCILSASVAHCSAPQPKTPQADDAFHSGNYQEALDAYRQFFSEELQEGVDYGPQLSRAVQCFGRLNRVHEWDAFVQQVRQNAEGNWQTLFALAELFEQSEHRGWIVEEQFFRGRSRRETGRRANRYEADRVEALRLYRQAFEAMPNPPPATAQARNFFLRWAWALRHGRLGTDAAWRMQQLTDLSTLPQPDDQWWNSAPGPPGAPVTAAGTPVFYTLPESLDSAGSDGERWRWVLSQGSTRYPDHAHRFLIQRAETLQSQFGVQTLRQFPGIRGNLSTPDDTPEVLKLSTLKQTETIARLATGVKRFSLPDEHNHVLLFQEALRLSQEFGHKQTAPRGAAMQLAKIFENRRQYPRAAEYWRMLGSEEAKHRIEQITGNWGQLGSVPTQQSDSGATVSFRYRNAKRVEFTAQKIDVPALLKDVQDELRSNPDKLDHKKLQVEQLGYRMVRSGGAKYLGGEAARWALDLDPLQGHFDRTVEVTTPLQQPGAYLLTADVEEGNSTSVVVWVQDTAIATKQLDGRTLYYLADSTTGEPVAGCKLDLFGYHQRQIDDGNQYEIETDSRSAVTSPDGLAEVSLEGDDQRFNWLVTATTPDGRFAHLGFDHIWSYRTNRDVYQQLKVFTVTDRPVYRPGQETHFKFWVRTASYELEESESRFAGQSFRVELRNPAGEVVHAQTLVADAFGGLEGSWQIPEEARLGVYRLNVVNHGGGYFRVEEYKKPEYEVTVEAPDKPTALGDTIHATINARYYYGQPVTEATVRYRVYRTAHRQGWYPPTPWDWLYGSGHAWSPVKRFWYPGRTRWGCFGPNPPWVWFPQSPPELVADRQTKIGPDGKVKVEIDTSLAKALHPDQDHSYSIEAEVVDRSRRTIVGRGKVVASRQPFQVFVWTHRGHYRPGDTVSVSIAARDAGSNPVAGAGTLRLLKIRYENSEPLETEVGSWELATDQTGTAALEIKAADAGQYRLAYNLTSEAGQEIEGAQFFSVRGQQSNDDDFRFDGLEVIPDKTHYRAGDEARLLINSDRPDATVLLFVRAESGTYPEPRVIRLKGKSAEVLVEILPGDAPNIFVEAVAVHTGRVHTVTRELFVPPESRVLQVEVLPNSEAYLPGQEASAQIRVTDNNGKPVVGSLAATVYDRSLEYISGGSNVGDIREFFWKWKRNHYPRASSNLNRTEGMVSPPNKPSMQTIGVFGDYDGSQSRGRGGVGGGYGGEPMSLGVPVAGRAMAGAAMADGAEAAHSQQGGDAPPEVYLRTNLADAAVWTGSLETDEQGIAQLDFTMPENLTAWRIRVWAVTHGTRVGEGQAEVVTRKNLTVRLQTPRFLVEQDEAVFSANVHNYLPDPQRVEVTLSLAGGQLSTHDQLTRVVSLEPGSERRVDWRVEAVREGEANIAVTARAEDESDGVQVPLPVLVRGILQTESYTGVIRPNESAARFSIDVPAERRPEQTKLELEYSPSLAATMFRTLPFLIEYPHGCTEQTLNRFLPAAICRATLRRRGLSLSDLQPEATPEGHPAPPAEPPVLSDETLDEIIRAGITRLRSMQLSDGGWGWFSGYGERSYPHTTAVVVRGLLEAERSGVDLPPGVLKGAVAWLFRHQQQQIEMLERWPRRDLPENKDLPVKEHADNQDALTLLVLAQANTADRRMVGHLSRSRARLTPYGLAALGLALHHLDETDELAEVMRNLRQYVRQDNSNQTAWLELPESGWWYWHGDDIETQAMYLKLLAATDADGELAPRVVKYLVNNRRNGTYWKSTRDTALVVEAMADYLAATGEDAASAEIEIRLDGETVQQASVSPDDFLSPQNRLSLSGELLDSGRHEIEILKRGEGTLYYGGYLTNFTLEKDFRSAGLELRIDRRYYRVSREATQTEVPGGRGQAVGQKTAEDHRMPLAAGEQLQSGDLVEVELIIESKNDYEYILLEDPKVAGFEPVEARSGYSGNQLGCYVEYRDQRVLMYAARVPRGRHSVTYRLRAEVPGRFTAMPTRVSAMYAPRLKGNSRDQRFRVED